jgi:hypothetical protein
MSRSISEKRNNDGVKLSKCSDWRNKRVDFCRIAAPRAIDQETRPETRSIGKICLTKPRSARSCQRRVA